MEDSLNYDFNDFAGLPTKILTLIFEHEIKRDEAVLNGLEPCPPFTRDKKDIEQLLIVHCVSTDFEEWPNITKKNIKHFRSLMRDLSQPKRPIDHYLKNYSLSRFPNIFDRCGTWNKTEAADGETNLISVLSSIIQEESIYPEVELDGINFKHLGGSNFSFEKNRYSKQELNRVILEAAYPMYITNKTTATVRGLDTFADADVVEDACKEFGNDARNALLLPVNTIPDGWEPDGLVFKLEIDQECFDSTVHDDSLVEEFERWFKAERNRRGFNKKGRRKDLFGDLLDLAIFRLINAGFDTDSELVINCYEHSLPQRASKDAIGNQRQKPGIKEFTKESRRNIQKILRNRKKLIYP